MTVLSIYYSNVENLFYINAQSGCSGKQLLGLLPGKY